MENLRLFIAVETPEDLKKIIEEKKHLLSGKMKFVEKANLHITLTFLKKDNQGILVEDVEKIKKQLSKISENLEPIEIEISRLKPIPAETFIRVLAFDIKNKEKIIQLQSAIKTKLTKLKITSLINPAHLTLSRLTSIENKENLLKTINSISINYTFKAEHFSLFQSILSRSGPEYKKLCDFNFKKS